MSKRTPPNVADLLVFLSDKFDFDRASLEDVDWIANTSEHVTSMSMRLGRVVTQIGCLVSEDTATGSGAFNAETLPDLLWNIGDSLETISRLSSIVADANFYLQKRQSKPEKPAKKAEVARA